MGPMPQEVLPQALVKDLEAKPLKAEEAWAWACYGSVILLAMFLALLVAMFSKGAEPLKLQLL